MADATSQPEARRGLEPRTPAPIRTPDQRLRVFVSSTLQELAEERAAAREAIAGLRLAPVLFELGARPHPPRRLYRAYLAQSHVFVGIYWQRYGWVAPGEEVSGLEDEYRLAGRRPKLIYVKTPAPEREPRLAELLARIRDDDDASYKPFRGPGELRELLADDLALLLTERFDGARPDAPAPAPDAAPAIPAPASSLPATATSFVGREAVLRAAARLLLRPDVRLLTLVGPGGIGKTRLALELATRLGPRFADGVVFVPLAAVADAALVPARIARALGLRERDGPVEAALARTLAGRRALLLLDNFEHVLEAGTSLAALLAAAPGPTLLVTSRAALRLTGEHELPVPPLARPGATAGRSPAELLRWEAVRLFVERARAVRPDFELDEANAEAVLELARLLDGLPLAIELAAARLRALSPQTLLARMERRLPLLTDGPRDLPDRQRTLRATIDWSYDLLAAPARRLFACLAVFEGGADLEAIEAVCGEGHEEGELFERLLGLVDWSLVGWRETADGPRYAMLDIVREYALERLEETDDPDALRGRHAAHYLALAEAASEARTGPGQAELLARLDTEHDNLHAALRHWAGAGRAAEAQRLAAALRWYWMGRGRLTEGRRALERALGVAGETPSTVRADALAAAGVLAWRQGDIAAARPALEEALALHRGAGDRAGAVRELRILGILCHNQGAFDHARELLGESRRLAEALGDGEAVAAALLGLGNVALDRGEPDARALYRESLELSRGLGDALGEAFALDNLGVVAWHEGELDEADRLTDEAEALYRRLGHRSGLANTEHRRGLLALERGDAAAARPRLERALAEKRALGEMRAVAFVLVALGWLELRAGEPGAAGRFAEGLALAVRQGAAVLRTLHVEGAAACCVARGDPLEGARLRAAAAGWREALRVPIIPVARHRFERAEARLRERLGETAFRAAWEEGRGWDVATAVARAEAALAAPR